MNCSLHSASGSSFISMKLLICIKKPEPFGNVQKALVILCIPHNNFYNCNRDFHEHIH